MENTSYKKDQVFISFRGRDERFGFLTHLKQKLIDGNVNVFTDDNVTGQPLQNLFGHIRNSRIAIVIFSENYAESHWCLEELVEIKKCLETEKLSAVIPIFHKVQVSSVREQSGIFGEKFLALQNSLLAKEVTAKKIRRINSKIKKWRKALEIVTGMAGLTYDNNSPELAFVDKVVEKVNINLANIAAGEGRNTTPGTSKSNDLKPLSRAIRRTVSDLDYRDQVGLSPFERVMVQKNAEIPTVDAVMAQEQAEISTVEAVKVQEQVENQQSIENVPEKKKRWPNLPFISALLVGALFVSYMVRRKRRSKGTAELNLPLQATANLF
uniref:Toll-interleukin-resistance domain-containing protein n=1 Tax=Capsella rubella TaxID=81985 RepID=B2WSA8_9BRAS|nr:toll-interleukin-resistance domain-containing protein [Capsella rubella]